MLALKPDDYDFVSNFDTVWAVVLGAFLATIGGFIATQLEAYFEHRRRERNAALFFGEVLSTLRILLNFAADTKKVGDPYGPVTMRMLRSARREIDIYERNRESLYDLRDGEMRARIHTLILRIGMPIDGIFDSTTELDAAKRRILEGNTGLEERTDLEQRMAQLSEARENGFEFLMSIAAKLEELSRDLEPLAGHSFERVNEVANR